MEFLLIVIFVVGYAAIALEHNLHINKSAPALLTGVLCWAVYVLMGGEGHEFIESCLHHLHTHLAEIAQILLFLLAAMTVVELVDAHNGFSVITSRITTKSKIKLLWIISWVTFFLSAVLDNLTTTIVMVSMLRKLVKSRQERLFFVSLVIIAANAGGAWSPIGDVTTTMLWIGGQISAGNIMIKLILPSIVCLLLPLIVSTFMLQKERKANEELHYKEEDLNPPVAHHQSIAVAASERNIIFIIGILGLIFVPIFKTITHLPPFMGITFSLGVLWLVTEIMHKGKPHTEKSSLSVVGVLSRVDVPSVLFFLGILIAVACLQAAGILAKMAIFLDKSVQNIHLIAFLLGILSAIVDNVPLVAAAMGMYSLEQYPIDHTLWEFISYCAGTGGSSLIIGSAAGVAAMGMENIDFMWYFKRITLLALLGYVAGAAFYMVQFQFLG